MGGGTMKLHKFARGVWEHGPTSSSLDTHGCKRLCPLAPKLSDKTDTVSVVAFDLKSFIRPHCGPRKLDDRTHSQQATAAQLGGTRWNPTQEQIGKLELLYRNGMRTPNAQQIEQITSKLAKYGKIEGKNVFYWFQNHKARERQKQKQKRNNYCPMSTSSSTHSSLTTTVNLDIRVEAGREEHSLYKRKCMSGIQERMDDNNKSCRLRVGENRTLELFPLRPERRP